MEEKFLKEILDVVTDIKAEQKIMKEKITSIEGKMTGMEGRMTSMEEKVDKIVTEQLVIKEAIHELKTDNQLLNYNVNRLLREQEDTKLIVSASVQKIGEVSDKLDRHIRECNLGIVSNQ